MSHDPVPFEVRTVMAKDLPTPIIDAIIALADLELGPGYLDRRQILTHQDEPAVAYAVDAAGGLKGFAIGKLPWAATITRAHPTARAALAGFGSLVGLIETVVVVPEARRQGLGARLLRALLDKAVLPPAFCPTLLPAWRRADGAVAADRLARRLGFVPYVVVPDYWLADSQARGYQCPTCGNPCHCAANLYLLSDSSPPSLRT